MVEGRGEEFVYSVNWHCNSKLVCTSPLYPAILLAIGGRVSLRFNPTEALSINLAAEYANRSFSPGAYASTDLNTPGNGPTGPGCNANGYVQVAPKYAGEKRWPGLSAQ